MKAEHTSTRICEDAGNVKSLYTHPKLYTSLLQTDKGLVYYDMMALQLIWKIEYSAIPALQNGDQRLCVAFSLDFNVVYVVSYGIIYRFEYLSKNQKAQCPRLTIHRMVPVDHQEPPHSLAMSVLQKYWIIVNQSEIVINTLEIQELSTIPTDHTMHRCHMLNQTANDSQHFLSIFNSDIILSVVAPPSYSIVCSTTSPIPIIETTIDETKEILAVMSQNQIDIYSYQGGRIAIVRSFMSKLPRSILIFHFAQSIDAVGRRYQQNIIVTMNEHNNHYRMALMMDQSQDVKIISTTPDIYFNPLFNNCLILRSDKGEMSLVNLYGYDKEWVTLGFRFVHIAQNQMYFEREDDFEFEMNKKKLPELRIEQLDDYSHSLLSEKELDIKTAYPSKFRRIAFEI